MNIFSKMKESLKKTKENIASKINLVMNQFTKIDEEFLDELEETLVMADIGIKTSEKICGELRGEIKRYGLKNPVEIKKTLQKIIIKMLDSDIDLKLNTKPSIILVVGVNGVGKTTTIGKLAYRLKNQGKKVLVAAGDTFRAAAIEQLEEWTRYADCDIVKKQQGADSASVVYDAIAAAVARNIDVIICDTAGRLHNKSDLMRELGKIGKVIKRELPEHSIETLLVIDATTGQNALNQAVEFGKVLDLTGVIVTKLDGSAKGGIVLTVRDNLNIPIKYVGLGEKIDDLEVFDAKDFVEAIIDVGEV